MIIIVCLKTLISIIKDILISKILFHLLKNILIKFKDNNHINYFNFWIITSLQELHLLSK